MMKKRSLYLMLVFCMVFTLMPMTAFASGSTYGDFTVNTTVENGCAYNSGVLTFTKEGEYTVGMADGKTATADVIVVTAEHVTLNLNRINIGAPTGTAGSINGADAFTCTNGTTLHMMADSSFTGGKGADSGQFQYSTTGSGGNGIKGNVTVSGTAKLIATAGLAGLAGGWYWNSGNAISGNLTVSGDATVILDGRYGSPHPAQAITGTLTATDSIVKEGSDPSTILTVQNPTNKTSSYSYITIEPISTPTAAEYAAANPAAASDTDYKLNDTDKTLIIYTAKGAAWWSANSAKGLSDEDGEKCLTYTVKLANDINVSAFLWTPVGTFKGNFDGQNHTITGLTVDVNMGSSGTAYAGLFGIISGASGTPVFIQNVGLIDSSVTATSSIQTYAGGIAARASDCTITNCYNTGSVTAVQTGDSGSGSASGIVAALTNNSTVTNCYNTGNITGNSNQGSLVGGIIVQASGSTVTNCYNTGNISATGTTNFVGGIVNAIRNNSTVTNCYNTGSISATGTTNYIGGIIELADESSPVTNCYYLSTVAEKGIQSIWEGGSATNCGTFDSSGTLAAGTADQFSGLVQTLENGSNLLAVLNGWVQAQTTPADYQTWTVKTGVNGGYPVFGTASPTSYAITTSTATNGSYTVKVGSSQVTSANAGDTITITPTPSSGYELDKVTVYKTGDTNTSVAVNSNTFTMPAFNVTINVTFKVKTNTPTNSGGSGGGSGGSSASTTPAAPVIVSGKTESIGKSEATTNETKVTVDSNKLTEKIGTAEKGGNVQIPVSDSKAAATAEIVVKNVEDMAKKDMTLEVKSGNVSYELPTTALDTEAVMKVLGASDANKVPLSLTIKKLDESAVTVVNGELVVPPMEFTVTATYGSKTVEVKDFSQYVQRSIEISKEQAAQITTAVVKNADGSLRHVPTYVYQKDGKWFAKINSRTNSTYALIRNEKTFIDAKGKWYENIVSEMASRKIINGKSETNFDGESSITRAEFAAILVRGLGLPIDGVSSFTDVNAGDWYYGSVGTAVKFGLVNGYANGSFAPNANITRQEAMVMVQRAAKIAEFSGATGSLESFNDQEQISSWAKIAAEFNVGSGLILGSNGKLRASDDISRAETATIILRLLQKSELVDVRSKT